MIGQHSPGIWDHLWRITLQSYPVSQWYTWSAPDSWLNTFPVSTDTPTTTPITTTQHSLTACNPAQAENYKCLPWASKMAEEVRKGVRLLKIMTEIVVININASQLPDSALTARSLLVPIFTTIKPLQPGSIFCRRNICPLSSTRLEFAWTTGANPDKYNIYM